MDWTLILIVLGFVAFLGGRAFVGICFEGSWLNSVFDSADDLGGGEGDDGCGGDGGGD
ncbi:hypothetical protein [Marivita sp.]|uniref:hypothetical protein n=1 Tax=Marivita sp. TaxID=2003365 RepID=UPI0025B8FE37|nr:hypothetical protein [Marivita sp.]